MNEDGKLHDEAEEIRVETAADPNAGRGSTIRHLHCSEVARWPGDAAQTLAALGQAADSTPAAPGHTGAFSRRDEVPARLNARTAG